MSYNEPSKANGQVNSMLGQAKELVGSGIEYATGSKEPSSWTTAGKEQHAKGEAEIKAAQAQGYVEGAGDRLEGKKDSIVGAITGDKAQQTKGNLQHDKGEAKMNVNGEHPLLPAPS
ncbi:uncharacterized protein MKK02DRAFT_38019 [Dioszegia hungarica]|uniref:CsbD-like domain-containing protein n=1 Tax=Dioszegia hungarica TaxID=4972 RepID=A0AA38H7Q5_9TREE|nr:uncharacterized protein MKK02DRAFT_38019 [Dioszegia hungarica]KAI9634489.1 hypothetical protein MKK02DRAFT_38019 [Dioszegia hungarica]